MARKVSLLVGLVCLLVYNANLRSITAGDTYPARYLPFALLHHHSLRLDAVEAVCGQGRGDTAYWMQHPGDGHAVSLFPVVVPVLLTPLYIPAVVYLDLAGWTDLRLDQVARIMEKLCASLIAALSSALLFLLLRRRTSMSHALVLTAAFAFGTTTWVISSQALWQHGLGQLLCIGALLVLTSPPTVRRTLAVGLLCALLACNRPPDAVLGAALFIYALIWAGRRRALLFVAAALPVALVLLYNLAIVGHFGGGYGRKASLAFMQHALVPGVAALLFSPMRGLLVFSPFLVFLGLAWRHVPRERGERILTAVLFAAAGLQLVLYAKADWRSGIAWGPRFMTDLLPFLVWLLVPVVDALRGFGRACFRVTVAVAIVIEIIGAFWYTGETDARLYAGPGTRPAWVPRNAAFIASPPLGLAPRELFVPLRGAFEAVDAVTVGDDVTLTGWALQGHATPWKVAVAIDGQPRAFTRDFVDRPDVGGKGWRIPLGPIDLAPGVHRLTILVWGSERGEGRFLSERKLAVRVPAEGDFTASARNAAARIRAHQQPTGAWLTQHTRTTSFASPSVELNTFTTALLVDLLAPLEGALGDSLPRARAHLSAQIEATGLVRYHGLPDAPGIGTLGCVITPDTDDTALAWRIAPRTDAGLRSAALAEIERYRTGEGLYRTWLASREAYQCIDPGSDPNPADLAIQMHLLLLFAEAQPQAGRALCDALHPVVDEDRVWVYYRVTPLVPILRLPDLRRAGCDLELPPSRMSTPVPGQERWVAAVRLLARDAAARDAAEIDVLLRALAADDFALLREQPPLLYHNDLSASVRRYYWSEDVGYALWLRLYEATLRRP